MESTVTRWIEEFKMDDSKDLDEEIKVTENAISKNNDQYVLAELNAYLNWLKHQKSMEV